MSKPLSISILLELKYSSSFWWEMEKEGAQSLVTFAADFHLINDTTQVLPDIGDLAQVQSPLLPLS